MEHTVWEYAGRGFALDFEDADTLGRAQEAFARMGEAERAVRGMKDTGAQGLVRAYCAMYEAFFDALLGEGTSRALFDGCANARACEEAYASLLAFIRAQIRRGAQRRRELMRVYGPARARRETT